MGDDNKVLPGEVIKLVTKNKVGSRFCKSPFSTIINPNLELADNADKILPSVTLSWIYKKISVCKDVTLEITGEVNDGRKGLTLLSVIDEN